MPSLDEVIQFRQQMFDESMSLIKQKGHDYNRTQQEGGDTLFNLRVCEILGIVPSAERGILVRLSDKFMRLISLVSPGVEASVKDESVKDTVKDIHNYVDYLLLMYLQRIVDHQYIAKKVDNHPQAGAYRAEPDYAETTRVSAGKQRG